MEALLFVTRVKVFSILLLVQLNAISQFSVSGLSVVPAANRSRVVVANGGVVAADHRVCSDIGERILKQGGHAVDSTVGVTFCQGIVNPGATGIGGGGFLIVRLANGTAEAYDFRESAPGLSTEDMYEKNKTEKVKGGLSAGVPGEVAGLYKVWHKYGKLRWKDLLRPAIRLCARGFVVEPYLAKEIATYSADILADEGLRDAFAPNGTLLQAGDICYRKQLAKTLNQIAKHGPGVFYGGAIGKRLVQDVQSAGGIITLQDLEKYEVKVSKPTVAETWGLTLLGMPPPSSGGAGVTLILNILAGYNVDDIKGNLGTHRLIEAFKHTYAVRMNLGDPDFSNMTSVVQDMLSPTFAKELRAKIADNTTYPPKFYGGKWGQLNDHGTSHICVVDAERNAVSVTTTINYSFGSKLVSLSTGVLLNNEMDDFSTPTDNTTNALPPSKVNFIRPYKRPLSSMSPMIVLEVSPIGREGIDIFCIAQKGQLRAVLGGSGGIKILTTVAQVLLKHIAGYDPLEAVELPRVHHQLEPNWVSYENFTAVRGEHIEVPLKTREFLSHVGHELRSSNQAVCQFVLHDLSKSVTINSMEGIHIGKLTAVSDVRKDGYPAGY